MVEAVGLNWVKIFKIGSYNQSLMMMIANDDNDNDDDIDDDNDDNDNDDTI